MIELAAIFEKAPTDWGSVVVTVSAMWTTPFCLWAWWKYGRRKP